MKRSLEKNIFQRSFVEKCRGVIGEASAAQQLSHAGTKGRIREIIAEKILTPVLPPSVKIGSGHLVTAQGNTSPQTDLILYAPSILPPFIHDASAGFFPIESCLYSIEVRSKINSNNIEQTIKNARRCLSLSLLQADHWPAPMNADQAIMPVVRNVPHPLMGLVSFASDLKGNPTCELGRYRSCDHLADTNPALQLICIIGRGYWYSVPGGWCYIETSDHLGEIMGLIAGIINTIPGLMANKGQPRFGQYLLPNIPSQRV